MSGEARQTDTFKDSIVILLWRIMTNWENCTMSKKNATIAIFEDHTGAEDAVKELQKSGFDVKKLSIVGKDFTLMSMW